MVFKFVYDIFVIYVVECMYLIYVFSCMIVTVCLYKTVKSFYTIVLRKKYE